MRLDELMRRELGAASKTNVDLHRPAARLHSIELVLNIMRTINTSLVLSEVLDLVVDGAIQIARAERGFIMLADADGRLEYKTGRNSRRQTIGANTFEVSASVLQDVFLTGESVCIENALCDERFDRRESILNLELQTIVCSALRTPEKTIGVIYVDSTFIQAMDRQDVINLFEVLAGQAAVAINNARLYQELGQAYEELQAAQTHIIKSERLALQGELIAEVSHELKNLVGIVLLNLDLLKLKVDSMTPSERRAMVECAIRDTSRIDKFSRSLLTRNRAAAQKAPVPLNTIAVDFGVFMNFLPKFKHNKVGLFLSPDTVHVLVDIDQIQQVLLNLVNNSVEARPDASFSLITTVDEDAGVARLEVADDGPGIDPALAGRLFLERITTKPDGHGYGLTNCRLIMESHGGKIHLESTPGKGATIVLTFPIAPAPVPETT